MASPLAPWTAPAPCPPWTGARPINRPPRARNSLHTSPLPLPPSLHSLVRRQEGGDAAAEPLLPRRFCELRHGPRWATTASWPCCHLSLPLFSPCLSAVLHRCRTLTRTPFLAQETPPGARRRRSCPRRPRCPPPMNQATPGSSTPPTDFPEPPPSIPVIAAVSQALGEPLDHRHSAGRTVAPPSCGRRRCVHPWPLDQDPTVTYRFDLKIELDLNPSEHSTGPNFEMQYLEIDK